MFKWDHSPYPTSASRGRNLIGGKFCPIYNTPERPITASDLWIRAQQFLKAQPGPQGLAHRRGSEQRELHFFEPIGGRALGSGDAPDVGIAAIHSPSVNLHE
jgi:hypothetical protein